MPLAPVLAFLAVSAGTLLLYLDGPGWLSWPAFSGAVTRSLEGLVAVSLAFLYLVFPAMAARSEAGPEGPRRPDLRAAFYQIAAIVLIGLPLFALTAFLGGRGTGSLLRSLFLIALAGGYALSWLALEARVGPSVFPVGLAATAGFSLALPFLAYAFLEFLGRAAYEQRLGLVFLSPVFGGPRLFGLEVAAHFGRWGPYLLLHAALILAVWTVGPRRRVS